MFQFFNSIASALGILYDFIESIFKLIMMLFTEIPKAVGFIVTSVAYLPPFLTTFVLLFVSIIVILNVINKGA